jgi:predicted porin
MYNYKKSAAALAVGALFAAPAAFAQDTVGNVQIYGKLYPQFASAKTSGATAVGDSVSTLVGGPTGTLPAGNFLGTVANGQNHAQRYSVDVANSYLGFRGEESLGGPLRAIWQIEQSLGFDTGATDVWATRNSFLGLRGGFGTIKLGNMDTIYKEYGDTFGMFGISSGNFVSASNVLSHFQNVRAARFHERRPNSVQYETPEFSSFTAGIQYGPDESKGNPGTTQDARWWSYGVKYGSERFYASLHQELHYDTFGGSNNVFSGIRNGTTAAATGTFTADTSAHSKDQATRFSAEFRPGAHRFTADIARIEYKESSSLAGTRFQNYRHVNWAVGWEARWGGAWRTAVQYIQAGEGSCELSGGVGCTTAGLKAKMLTGGVAYSLSKRTFLFAIGAQLTNDRSAAYDNWSNANPAVGADITQFALGASHTF